MGPFAHSDGHDFPRLVDELVPGVATAIDDLVVGFEDARSDGFAWNVAFARFNVRGCAKCASGEGHRLSVLTVSYPAGRTRQFSLRGETAPQVRRRLANYQRLKEAIEVIFASSITHCFARTRRQDRGGNAVIEMRRVQRSFGDGLIAEEVKDLREGWMDHADRLLDDEARAFEADPFSRTCAVASRLPSLADADFESRVAGPASRAR